MPHTVQRDPFSTRTELLMQLISLKAAHIRLKRIISNITFRRINKRKSMRNLQIRSEREREGKIVWIKTMPNSREEFAHFPNDIEQFGWIESNNWLNISIKENNRKLVFTTNTKLQMRRLLDVLPVAFSLSISISLFRLYRFDFSVCRINVWDWNLECSDRPSGWLDRCKKC